MILRKMIEVFRTNVSSEEQARMLGSLLAERFGLSRISFDLEDHERVLRVEGPAVYHEKVSDLLYEHGYECSVME
ncbi:hypothetical protein GCM10023093_20710 [Nemorincola caseinilytica]|uniref:HMA domain-containing protein n=1 Tax=Nemorincola caseinilytica TaxID=2054315 RepID=A0ABP8NIY2_9BACT